MSDVFPIDLRACETPHYTSSPYQYREVFRAALLAADPRASYYAFDVTVHSPTAVSFIAYDMRDNLYGGIGNEVWRGKASVPASLTRDDVERAIFAAAKRRRALERVEEENAVIRGYAEEIRKAEGLDVSGDAPALVAERVAA